MSRTTTTARRSALAAAAFTLSTGLTLTYATAASAEPDAMARANAAGGAAAAATTPAAPPPGTGVADPTEAADAAEDVKEAATATAPTTPAPTTTAAPATPAPAAVGARSGLSFDNGVFANDPARAEEYAQVTGKPLDVYGVHPERGSWDTILGNTWWLEGAPAGAKLDVAVPLGPGTGSTLEQTAAGEDRDKWVQLGRMIAEKYPGSYVRPGWEFNITSFDHHATPENVETWKRAFQQAATGLREGAGGPDKIRVTWNPNKGKGDSLPDAETAYPGDEYVDVVGLDGYDWWPEYTNETVTEHLDGEQGWQHWIDFARAHGKKFAVPEWGIAPGHAEGGGDNPFFIQQLTERLDREHAKDGILAYQSYFDEPAGYINSTVIDNNPQARDALKGWLASAPAKAPNAAPGTDTTAPTGPGATTAPAAPTPGATTAPATPESTTAPAAPTDTPTTVDAQVRVDEEGGNAIIEVPLDWLRSLFGGGDEPAQQEPASESAPSAPAGEATAEPTTAGTTEPAGETEDAGGAASASESPATGDSDQGEATPEQREREQPETADPGTRQAQQDSEPEQADEAPSASNPADGNEIGRDSLAPDTGGESPSAVPAPENVPAPPAEDKQEEERGWRWINFIVGWFDRGDGGSDEPEAAPAPTSVPTPATPATPGTSPTAPGATTNPTTPATPAPATGQLPATVKGATFEAGGLSSTYHLFTDQVQGDVKGVVVHLDGDGQHGFDNPDQEYALGGDTGIAAQAGQRGYATLAIRTPDNATDTWWQNGEENAAYAAELIKKIKTDLGVGEVWTIGYSGGAELSSQHLVPKHSDIYGGGGAIMSGGGHEPSGDVQLPAGATSVRTYWHTGADDVSSEYDGISGARSGSAWYQAQGFPVVTRFPAGVGHDLGGEFGGILAWALDDAGVSAPGTATTPSASAPAAPTAAAPSSAPGPEADAEGEAGPSSGGEDKSPAQVARERAEKGETSWSSAVEPSGDNTEAAPAAQRQRKQPKGIGSPSVWKVGG